MKQCSSLKQATIAFPAIGTGNLGYPNDVVAQTMLKAVIDFMSSNKSTSISSVHLVIFMEDTYLAFQQELQAYSSGTALGTAAAASIEPAHYHSATSKPKPQSRRFQSAPIRDEVHTKTSTQGEHTFTIENLQVQILNGDVTEESSDVVVNPTNSSLKLEGQGVAGALLRKGGPELQKICDAVIGTYGKPLEGEKVLETPSSGMLKCKHLFHINFEGNDVKTFIKLIVNCLKKAENKKCSSISFPAIGTGTHGYPAQDAAAGLMKAIEQFSSLPPKHLKCIRVVLFQPSAYQEFLVTFRNPAQPGLLERIWNYATKTPTWKSPEDEEFESLESETERLEVIKELRIIIYGDNEKTVADVEKEVDSLIEENFTTEEVDDPNVDKLSKSEVQKLKQKGKELQVFIEIDSAPLNRIHLKGDRADVQQMKCYIIELFSEYEKNVSRKREAEQLYQLIRWKRMDSSESEYDPETNYEIEQAYKSNKPTHTIKDHFEGQNFTIDFNKLLAIDHNNQGSTVNVRRFDLVKQMQQGTI